VSLDARSDEYLDLPASLATTERKTYVLDTSVLLADPGALFRFVEHEVVIPLVVISELEALRDQSNDHRILSVAKTLADEGFDTVVVTKDLPSRLKAAAVGIPADEYRSELAAPNEWPGIAIVDPAPSELIDALYEGARVDAEEVGHELLTHTSVILRSGS
jgi:PhoH-like ATPase